MKRLLFASVPLAVLGLLLIFVPLRVFPPCPIEEGMHPMKCHWTVSALNGFGGLFLLAGILLFLFKNNGVRAGISVMVAASAVLGGVIATYLIGMCMSPLMPCRTGTYPAVMIILTLTALAGLANAFVFGSLAKKEQGDRRLTPPPRR